MYSRYEARRESPIRLPENYSGTAFSGRPSPDSADTHRVEIAKPSPLGAVYPSPPPHKEPPKPLLPAELPVPAHNDGHKESPPPVSHAPALPLHVGVPFLHGIGFEELLILGLILLLSHTDEQSDVILWLALLLFCE